MLLWIKFRNHAADEQQLTPNISCLSWPELATPPCTDCSIQALWRPTPWQSHEQPTRAVPPYDQDCGPLIARQCLHASTVDWLQCIQCTVKKSAFASSHILPAYQAADKIMKTVLYLPGQLVRLWIKFCNCLFVHMHRSHQIRLAMQAHILP